MYRSFDTISSDLINESERKKFQIENKFASKQDITKCTSNRLHARFGTETGLVVAATLHEKSSKIFFDRRRTMPHE